MDNCALDNSATATWIAPSDVQQIPTDNRDTPYLLPRSVQDWLPEKHLAQCVVYIVEQLDLNPLTTIFSQLNISR